MISHPFEIEASANNQELDVLMVTWRGAPPQSVAEVYLPAVSASLIAVQAGRLYGRHRLTATDAHTIQFPAGDLALIPVPAGSGPYARLLSVEPHPAMPAGSSFTVSVRQLHPTSATIRPAPPSPPPPVIQVAHAGPAADVPKTRTISWRLLRGAFQYTVTATPRDILLPEQAALVAWLKWRLGVLPAPSRWTPVLQRYLNYTESLVWNLGTDPNTIPPSATGSVPGPGRGPEPHPIEGGHEYIGKVVAVLYDRFGDFSGFVILTEFGHEHRFRATEPPIEHLVREAWEERTVVSVLADTRDRERLDRLALLRRH